MDADVVVEYTGADGTRYRVRYADRGVHSADYWRLRERKTPTGWTPEAREPVRDVVAHATVAKGETGP